MPYSFLVNKYFVTLNCRGVRLLKLLISVVYLPDQYLTVFEHQQQRFEGRGVSNETVRLIL